MSEVELMAFFLNVYNMLTVHGLTKLRPATVLAVKNFWENTCYNIGGDIYSLDIIEHGILRRNKVHPDGKKTALPEGDPRATLLSTADPRIHFALNCGAKSCPPIRIYSEMTLERGLNAATRNFVENNTKIDMAKQEITISQLFQWYKADFGESIADVMAFIETYLPEDEEDELRTQYMTLKQKVDRGETVSVGYAQYKWALNAA
ncbi:hypothetical protein SARC_02631 [Sphaeroforma arctica JP610]|uniref:DUF547 domain-containing protein n=1 Tax=Sphaeroforma arctica JP610 TaxID=667725 RepID=A0A0L0G8E1_9EUKA|nr:hypothetical protein SARC_02631 [Sphaeroforma arctica JP610]KNC85174.1 hypothetical protein SARC_02631 [Sphaeroforma arctica JP610]|eukprot:XP_014159076.1 hypothetical protein SARC_02631 [Sphaeroforma arctica JP610]